MVCEPAPILGELTASLAPLLEISEFNELPRARRLLEFGYSNPNDTYEPSADVLQGAAISGQDFGTDAEYGTTILVKPILLLVLGILSLFFLNLALCCRNCFSCCKCLPNDHHTEHGHDHDSHAQRETFINHQKTAVFVVEMVLCALVMIADCVCYYGYGFIIKGANDLIEAMDMLLVLFDLVLGYANKLHSTDGTNFVNYATLAKGTCTGANAAGASNNPINILVTLGESFKLAALAIVNAITPLRSYITDGQIYVTEYLIGFSSTVVLVIWAFAAISVSLFILFRVCRSTCGTKIAIFWGQVTMLIILIFNMIFMILTQVLGDFCMDPSYNAVLNAGDGLRPMVQYYATCIGNDTVRQSVIAASDVMKLIATNTTQIRTTFSCQSDVNLNGVSNTALSASLTFATMANTISCPSFQAIWFKLINEALCEGFYSGIYSIWVSQFITSFFLFFLIVVATVSYQYFASTDTLVVPGDGDIEDGPTGNEFIDNYNSGGTTTGAGVHKAINDDGDIEYEADGRGDIELHKSVNHNSDEGDDN